MSDIVALRGDNESYEVTIVDAAGARVDLTGSSLWFTVKVSASVPDAQALVQKTVGSGITLQAQNVDATKGKATIVLTPADTAKLLAPRDYYYDVQLKTAGNVTTTVVSGDLSLIADITRAS